MGEWGTWETVRGDWETRGHGDKVRRRVGESGTRRLEMSLFDSRRVSYN